MVKIDAAEESRSCPTCGASNRSRWFKSRAGARRWHWKGCESTWSGRTRTLPAGVHRPGLFVEAARKMPDPRETPRSCRALATRLGLSRDTAWRRRCCFSSSFRRYRSPFLPAWSRPMTPPTEKAAKVHGSGCGISETRRSPGRPKGGGRSISRESRSSPLPRVGRRTFWASSIAKAVRPSSTMATPGRRRSTPRSRHRWRPMRYGCSTQHPDTKLWPTPEGSHTACSSVAAVDRGHRRHTTSTPSMRFTPSGQI